VLLSFLAVMVGVVVNALFMQVRPAITSKAVVDRAQTRPGAERQLHIARYAADPKSVGSTPAPAVAAEADADPETVRAIQRELKARGYGPLPGDGSVSLATRAAIMAFEHDQGLALTGEASDRLLKRILLGASAGLDAGAASKARSTTAEEVIRTVQQWLATLGYPPGRVDGRLADETVRAIRDFEVDKGLVPRGRVSAELVMRLSEAVASPARLVNR
jgi:peptidoglycan hydrolase-like protein with peptidoglycan-binding domain